jgi:hypothetical protein
MNSLTNFMNGSTTVRGREQIHPNFVQAPVSDYHIGHKIRMAILDQRFTDQIMTVGKVGYSVPDPVFFAMTPNSSIITSTPELKQTNSFKIGGCN